jgi:hypothetical protein
MWELTEGTGGAFFHNNNDLLPVSREWRLRLNSLMCLGFRRRIQS